MSPAGPDERLRRAEALIVVADLDEPRCSPEDAHHLLDVLRLGDGAVVAATDGAGRARLCRLRTAATGSRGRRREAALEALGAVLEEPPPARPITVAFALVKGDRSEWAVQKLTELGVDRIVPLVTARTVVRLDAPAAARRGDRLRRVAQEAASQSRRIHLPEVADPTSLEGFLGSLGELEPGAVALAEPGGGPLEATTRCVLVGPEGGWAPEEHRLVGHLLGLGPTVLRAETAAVVAGALLTAARAGTILAAPSD